MAIKKSAKIKTERKEDELDGTVLMVLDQGTSENEPVLSVQLDDEEDDAPFFPPSSEDGNGAIIDHSSAMNMPFAGPDVTLKIEKGKEEGSTENGPEPSENSEYENDNDDNDDDEVLYEIDVYQATSAESLVSASANASFSSTNTSLAANEYARLHVFQFPSSVQGHQTSSSSTFKVKRESQRFQYITSMAQDNHFSNQQATLFGRGVDDTPLLSIADHHRQHQQAGGRNTTHSSSSTPVLDFIQYSSKLLPKLSDYKVGIMKEEGLFLADVDLVVQMRPSLEYIDRIQEKERAASNRMIEVHGQEGRLVQQLVVGVEDKEAGRKATLAEQQKRADAEPWSMAIVHGSESNESKAHLNALFGAPDTPLQLIEGSEKYLDAIQNSGTRLESKTVLKTGMSLKQMSILPVEDQIRGILMNAHVVSLDNLIRLMPSIPEEALIIGLQKTAVCVGGLWVIRSDLLYSDPILSARQYLLYLFRSGPVSREKFSQMTSLPGPIVFNMLSEIASLSPQGWILKRMPYDDPTGFTKRFPKIAADQDKRVELEGLSALNFFTRSSVIAKPVKMEKTKKTVPKPVVPVSAAPIVPDAKLPTPSNPPVGALIVDAAASVKDELYTLYRDFILTLFAKKSSLKRKDITQAIDGSKNLKSIPAALYQKIMTEIATCKGGAWSLKDGAS